MFDRKLYFHRHVDYLLSQLGLIRFITYKFSSLDSLKFVYITLIHSKLQCAFLVWNNITSADSNKVEDIQ
jgi:hypothetical protein